MSSKMKDGKGGVGLALIVLWATGEPCLGATNAWESPTNATVSHLSFTGHYEEVYLSLDARDRAVVDRMSPVDRERTLEAREASLKVKKYLDEQRKRERDIVSIVPQKQEGIDNRCHIDSLLEKAYVYWLDDTNRHREVAVKLFEEYIEENPDSLFLGEIYVTLGSLYSCNVNFRYNEQSDSRMMVKYYRLAKEKFGRKFDYDADVAWGSLISETDSLDEMLEYYDWLRYLQTNGAAADIYPIGSIEGCRQGWNVTRTQEEKERAVRGMKENLKGSIWCAERNIFGAIANSESNLVVVANRYPDTPLGRQAAERLRKGGQQKTIESYFAATDLETNGASVVLHPVRSLESLPTGMNKIASSGPRSVLFGLGAVCLLAGLGTGIHTWRRSRDRGGSGTADS